MKRFQFQPKRCEVQRNALKHSEVPAEIRAGTPITDNVRSGPDAAPLLCPQLQRNHCISPGISRTMNVQNSPKDEVCKYV